MRIWRGRGADGASLIEYALLLAMVLLVVFASVYALGRTPEKPASVLSDTFSSPPAGGNPPSGSTTSTTSTTTTTAPPP
jgi:hypothetical protein